MGKSGHTWRIQKATGSTANNPMNTTPGMELLENPTVGHAGPKTGHPMLGERPSRSGQPPMAPRRGLPRSAGKAPAVPTTLWKGGRSTRREGRCPQRGRESGHPPGEETAPPAAAGGPWKDSWIRGGPQSAEEGARLRGEPSPPTGGEPGPRNAGESGLWTKETGTTRLATEKRRRLVWSLKPGEAPETPWSREGGLTKNVALTSASEIPSRIATFTVSKVLRGRSQTWNNLVSYLRKHLHLTDLWIVMDILCIWNLMRKNIYEKSCAWCIILKKVFLNAYFFWKLFAKIMAQRDLHFVSSQAIELLRIVPSLGQALSLPDKWGCCSCPLSKRIEI